MRTDAETPKVLGLRKCDRRRLTADCLRCGALVRLDPKGPLLQNLTCPACGHDEVHGLSRP